MLVAVKCGDSLSDYSQKVVGGVRHKVTTRRIPNVLIVTVVSIFYSIQPLSRGHMRRVSRASEQSE